MLKPPNFLFIITDQQRHDHLSCAGNPLLRTQHIDQLAGRGVRFENFYVASAVCMPNRASIMTGRMPSSHGVRFNGIPLSRDAVTFVDLLRANGYRTGLVGKAHLQNVTDLVSAYPGVDAAGIAPPDALSEARRTRFSGPEYELEREPGAERLGYRALETPFYGFDHVELCTRHGDRCAGHYSNWLAGLVDDVDVLRSRENLIPAPEYSAPQAYRTRVPPELHSTAYVAARGREFLERHVASGEDAPFFLQVSFPDPHHPYTPAGHYWEQYQPEHVTLPPTFAQADLPPTVAAIHELSRDPQKLRNPRQPFAVSARHAQEITALTYGMVHHIDDAVGQLMGSLQALGIADNTIVIFTSDHGDFMGDRGIMLKGPLHYQGIAKVPFVWMDPRSVRPGTTTDTLGSSLDISATVLAQAGLAPFHGLQGQDLSGVLDGTTSAVREGLLIEQDAQAPNFGFTHPIRARTLVTDRWRMSIYRGESFAELYDLQSDPHETKNLWDSAKERAGLSHQLMDLMTSLQDTSPRPLQFA